MTNFITHLDKCGCSDKWFCTFVNGSLNHNEPSSLLIWSYIRTQFWPVTSKQHKDPEQYVHIVKCLRWKTIIYNIDSSVIHQSRCKSCTNNLETFLHHCGWQIQEAKQTKERWWLHHWSRTDEYVWRVLDTTGVFCKTEYLRNGEEEDGRGWSAYQFSRKAT